MKINIKRMLSFCIIFTLLINISVYAFAIKNINSIINKPVLIIKNKHELAKSIEYIANQANQDLLDYNLSFFTITGFLEELPLNSKKKLKKVKIASLRALSDQDSKVKLLKFQADNTLSVILSTDELRRRDDIMSELIDAFIINENIEEKNSKAEAKKLFNQLAIIFKKF